MEHVDGERSVALLSRRAASAALLGAGVLEFHVARRITVDDEKGLVLGFDDSVPIVTPWRVVAQRRRRAARRDAVLFDHPPMVPAALSFVDRC